MNRRFISAMSAIALSTVLFTGCQEKKSDGPSATGTNDVAAKLAKADAVDGKTDKVVAKCAACSLGMDGSAEHELAVKDYKMHFCSADCKKSFEADPEKSVMAMKIP